MKTCSIILLVLLLSGLAGCAQTHHNMNHLNTEAFAKELTEYRFGDFFIYPMHDQAIEKIWQDPKNHALLDDVLNDSTISTKAQFLACEVFFKKDILFMQRHKPEKVAKIYADALRNNYTGMANSWGLLYEHQDDGPVGLAFLIIGEKAIPALLPLLDDESTALTYQGSIEATIGNGYRFRVKDFAAYYIGRILGSPLKYYPAYSERDQQIQALKKKLEASPKK